MSVEGVVSPGLGAFRIKEDINPGRPSLGPLMAPAHGVTSGPETFPSTEY